MKSRPAIRPGSSQGIALLEVLLCSFILATGIMAVLNMQTLALGAAQGNGHLLRAEWLLHDMLERMKANPSGFSTALAANPTGVILERCESPGGCSTAELAAHDLARWHRRLAELLPGGYGEIEPATVTGFPPAVELYRVHVSWQVSDGYSPAPGSSAIVVL